MGGVGGVAGSAAPLGAAGGAAGAGGAASAAAWGVGMMWERGGGGWEVSAFPRSLFLSLCARACRDRAACPPPARARDVSKSKVAQGGRGGASTTAAARCPISARALFGSMLPSPRPPPPVPTAMPRLRSRPHHARARVWHRLQHHLLPALPAPPRLTAPHALHLTAETRPPKTRSGSGRQSGPGRPR